jgi:hypothetical protein
LFRDACQVGGRLQEFPGSGTSLLSRLCSLKGLCLHLQRNITPTQFDTAIREVLQAVSTGCQGHGGRLEQLQLTCLSSRAGRLSTYWSAESLRALGGVAPNLQHLQLDLSTALGVGHTGAATSLLAHLPPGLKSLDLSAYPSQVSSNQGWSTWVPATSLQTLKLTLLEEGGFNVPPMDCHPLSAGSFQSLTLIDPVGAVISPSTICSSLPIALQKLSLQLLHGTGGLSAASLSQLTQLQVCVEYIVYILLQWRSPRKFPPNALRMASAQGPVAVQLPSLYADNLYAGNCLKSEALRYTAGAVTV